MKKTRIYVVLLAAATSVFLGGCGKTAESFMKPYDITSQQSEFSFVGTSQQSRASAFAADLCVANENVIPAEVAVTAETASVYCVDDKTVLYAKNVHQRMNPASLTKIMTALLTLESGRLDEEVTVTEEAMITESGATLCHLKPGDKLTLRQLLNLSMVRSGNDAAAAIAVFLGGSLSNFNDMMNQRAKELGATGTHFANPHGLTDEDHYTTAYDIYLMLKEALKYEEFLTIVGQGSYEVAYKDAEGKDKTNSFESTNRYVSGRVEAPEGITVIGGKTGTTNAAGSCLALITKGNSGKYYISVILKADSTDMVFQEMNTLLSLEN